MSKNFFKLVFSDLKAAKNRDPAARSYIEVLLTYSIPNIDSATRGKRILLYVGA